MEKYFKNPISSQFIVGINKLKQDLEKAEKIYDTEFDSIKDYLRAKGYIKPKDFTDFIFWVYIEKLNQNSLYPIPKITDNLFIEYSEWREDRLIKKRPPQNETDIWKGIPTFKNKFDNINPTEIYKHFKAGLVEKGYLSDKELNEYLKAAFELKTKPETLFKLKDTPKKQKIYNVFYEYYKNVAGKIHGKQKEYAALLGDYFEGYKTDIIQTNWARDYKTKR